MSLVLICLFSAVMTGTLAWRDYTQHKSNEFRGTTLTQHGHGYALLEKFDKETARELAGAEFELYRTGEKGDTLIGRYVTDSDGMIEVSRIEAGSYYWLETNPRYGYTYDHDADEKEIRKYPFEVGSNEDGVITLVSVTAYNERQKADLIITKTVVDLNGAGAGDVAQRGAAGPGEEPEEAGQGGAADPGAELESESGEQGGRADPLEAGLESGESQAGEADPGAEPKGQSGEQDGEQGGRVDPLETDWESGEPQIGTADPGAEPKGQSGEQDGEQGGRVDPLETDWEPGEPQIDPADPLFTFIVTFEGMEDGPVTVLIDGKEGRMEISEGRLTIKLKHGQEAVIKDLPVGARYTVAEAPADGYTTTGENHQGTIPPEGITAGFVNYHGGEEPGKLIVTKTVTVNSDEHDLDTEKQFRFVVTINGKETVIELRHGEKEEFILPPGASFSVREEDYLGEGYEASADWVYHTDDNVVVIEFRQTNKYVGPVLIGIEGEKTWDTGGENISLPDNITIYLKDGDVIAATAVVTPDGNGEWHYSFLVPKYRGDGVTEIVYTIEEAPVNGFSAGYDGYDILNTYIPPDEPGEPEKPDKPDKPDKPAKTDEPKAPHHPSGPKTGDESDTMLWAIMMIGSAFALRILLLYRKPVRK